ncbi:hypothetical protein HPHPP74_1439 [Helicobacter pylori Hp P-74]|nr:hypothetical protein HPHPP74_1439 [Helicobacter pylori Hp P-74]
MIKPCKIPIMGIQSQNQTLPNFNFFNHQRIASLNGTCFHVLMIP